MGGRLSHFLTEWESITSDKWVLSLIREGYKLEFIQKPPFRGIKETMVPICQAMSIEKEIENLLFKNAIERVSQKDAMNGFYSTLFLVPKKNGEMRPVINLRSLNRYLVKKHFKMDTMSKVLQLVEKGDWSITLDLSDAYFHLKIFKPHRKFLRFSYQGQAYQFRALSFGPTVAPRVFTKVTSVVAAHLRKQSIRLATYLDDWLVLNQILRMLWRDRFIVLSLLFRLGFIINKAKSSLVPSQNLTYIGGHFKLARGLVFPTQERVQGLKVAVLQLLQGQNTAYHYLVLLGKIASCLELIPNARLFMRPIQLHLLQSWSPVRMKMSYQIPVTPSLKPHLRWWLQEAHILKGRSVQPMKFAETLTTDASQKHGWGGHMNSQTVQGRWSCLQKLSHINCLEMEAVYLTMRHFLPNLYNKNVLIKTDNTTVAQYINHQGGTKSIELCLLTWKLWSLALALENNIALKAVHIMGKMNFLADYLSRQMIRQTEWSLNQTVVQKVFCHWGFPLMDLFATFQNKKTVLFMDSTSTSFCNRCNINFLAEHVCLCIPPNTDDSQGVAAYETVSMQDNSHSSTLAETVLVSDNVEHVDRLSSETTTLGESVVSGERSSSAPKSPVTQSDGMAAVDRHFSTKGFSERSRKLLSSSWRRGTKKDYNSKFKQFNSWCAERNLDPFQASLNECTDFLTSLFEKGLKYRTINGYRSMLSAILPPIDNCPVGQHPYIIRLLKGVFNERPPIKCLIPNWDLSLVLGCLKESPFEPLKDASLQHLTWKTCFLVAITTFRRCSDLQSLQIAEDKMNIGNRGITFMRTGLAKQDRPNHDSSHIFVPSHQEDRFLDPKRCLMKYIRKTKQFRMQGEENSVKLFLSIRKPHHPITAQTISKWIVNLIKLAYKLKNKSLKNQKIKGHSTRSVGPSWALFKGASFREVMESADWSTETTFIKHYLKSVRTPVLEV